MTLQHKSFPVSCVKALDEAQGIAEMVVSVFNNVDAAKDRVRPGFFKASLARKLPKGAWMHDWAQPVAKTLEATELQPGDSRLPEQIREYGGLYVKGQFNLGTQRGREAFSDLAFGTVDEFSFGYTVEKSAFDPKTGITDLLEGTIYEWSPVLVGCNPATALVGVKATPDTEHPKPDAEAKGQYLGDVEADATFGAIQSAWCALCYGPICEALYDLDQDQDTLEERRALIAGGLTEFSEFCQRVFDAIMTPAVIDAENAEPAEPADDYAGSQMEMMSLWPKPGPPAPNSGGVKVSAPPAGAFEGQLSAALAAVEAVSARASEIAALRAKSGRSISSERRSQIAALKAALDLLLPEPEPPTSAVVDVTHLIALRLKHRERTARLLAG